MQDPIPPFTNPTPSKAPFYKSWVFWAVLLYLLFIFLYNLKFYFSEGKNVLLSSNELGDFLSGVFAPLAFLFIILGYKQSNKNLQQNSEAIAQQAIALQQQAKSLEQQALALDTQIAELKVANESYLRQVDEMEKSVEAQQNMFLLAEKQYKESIEEKEKSLLPLLSLTGSPYTLLTTYIGSYDHEHKFNLTIKLQNRSIKNLIVISNFWHIARDGGLLDQSFRTVIDSVNIDKSVILRMYRRSNTAAFQNNILTLNYYDENNKEYRKEYSITKDSNDFVILKENSPKI
ncbi:hypothetical protein WBV14_14420 [Acinetobacter baumannii]